MLGSNDKFIIVKENKYSQLSFKMPQPLLFNTERLQLHRFDKQQNQSLSSEVPLVSFIRKGFKKT